MGESGSNSWSEATVEATYGPVGDQAFLVVRPPNNLDAGIHYDLEVTLLDVYQVDQRVAESQQDIATATQNNALIFSASPRPPVDEMIIMDNSGSMESNNKLDSAKNAARAFASRRQEGDMIGLAYFEDIADTLYDLTLISADESELAALKNQINTMSANGATALGLGLA